MYKIQRDIHFGISFLSLVWLEVCRALGKKFNTTLGSATGVVSSVCFNNHSLASVANPPLRAPRSTANLPGGSRKGPSCLWSMFRGWYLSKPIFLPETHGYSHNEEPKKWNLLCTSTPCPCHQT